MREKREWVRVPILGVQVLGAHSLEYTSSLSASSGRGDTFRSARCKCPFARLLPIPGYQARLGLGIIMFPPIEHCHSRVKLQGWGDSQARACKVSAKNVEVGSDIKGRKGLTRLRIFPLLIIPRARALS